MVSFFKSNNSKWMKVKVWDNEVPVLPKPDGSEILFIKPIRSQRPYRFGKD